MSSLQDTLGAPGKRSAVIQDVVRLVDDEVRSKGGVSGLAIKAGYKAVRALRPGLIEEAVDGLLDRFAEQLDPFYQSWRTAEQAGSFSAYLGQRVPDVANALLAVTDARAQHVEHKTIQKTYQKLRPHAQKNVEAAVPGLGRVLDRHATPADANA